MLRISVMLLNYHRPTYYLSLLIVATLSLSIC